MPTEVLFSNNAVSTLLAGITNAATALSVQAGKGALFASPGANQIQKITLFKTDLSAIEVVHLTARSGDTFTVVRGQEGTTAIAWNAGDGVMDAATAAMFTGLSQLDRTETATAKKTFSAGIAVAAGAAITGVTEFGNGIGPGYMNNIGIDSAVVANALITALKGGDGLDPSATNPVELSFRSTSLGSIVTVVRKISAPTSISVPQGATVGFVINTIGTFTVTIASPAVVTLANHGLLDGQMVRLNTAGALPTGLAAATDYFVKYIGVSTFNLAATLGGANINTSGTQSGVHTMTSGEVGYVYKYLVDNGTTRALAVAKKAVFDESQLYNTTAISAAADSDNVLYTTSAMTNCAVRLIGRELIQTGMNAAGDWPNGPTRREVWSPAMSKSDTTIATFSGSNASSFIVTATPQSPVNVEVGDLINLAYTTGGNGNFGSFSVNGSVNVSGTAVLESAVPTAGHLPFFLTADANIAGSSLAQTHSTIRRVITAGTITSAGLSSFTTLGTAPINQAAHLRVVVVRPNP